MIRLLCPFLVAASLFGAETPLMQQPAVSRTHVAFVYDGQVWVVPRGGTAARRVTDSKGRKFDPRFSPDGQRLAFASGEYADALNLYTVPVGGGAMSRVTYLPGHQLLCQWTSDDRLLFYTNSQSFVNWEMELFTVSPRGEIPARLPIAYGADGALDETGEWLAYTPQYPSSLINQWKRYRGGAAPDIRLLNLRTRESLKVSDWNGVDLEPMWHGRTLYYVSDEGAENRRNVWAYDTAAKRRRQVTHFRDFDVRNASIGGGAIVFQQGADLRLLDLSTETSTVLRIDIPAAQRPPVQRAVDAAQFITARQLSPDGRELLLEARGDLWIGSRNLTSTSGAFEREASRSPDRKWIAYSSDVTGENEIYVRSTAGADEPRQLTRFGNGYRFRPVWSPDSRKLAFFDQSSAIYVVDIDRGNVEKVDADPFNEQPELAWFADSAALAYTRVEENYVSTIWRYDLATKKRQRMTATAFQAGTPAFDRAGRTMFFISYRNFSTAVYDWTTGQAVHRATSVLMAVPLAALGGSFDARDVERNAVRLATATGSIAGLSTSESGDAIFGFTSTSGETSVRRYDVEKKKETVIDAATNDFDVAADGRHILLVRNGKYFVRDLAAAEPAETEISRAGMNVTIDLRAEWREIYRDAWRLVRDYFYAPKVKGAFYWDEVGRRYAPLVERVDTRNDLNWVLAQMLGEVGVGHAYMGEPGDVGPRQPPHSIGMLGADFALENGLYRITRIHEGPPWADTVRSPLRGVSAGEFLFAVNGVPVDTTKDPRAAFDGLAGKKVTIRVGPSAANARDVEVTPVTSETELRAAAWAERNRAWVDEVSGGRIGYLRVSDFGMGGFNSFMAQFGGQLTKHALIVDPRWSPGGWTGGLLAETLSRPELNFMTYRYATTTWPANRLGVHHGPKVLLVNHMTVSAGENFAYYFRKLKLGPLVGSRTWGGLTGINPVPPLIDGGSLNVPAAPFSDRGEWIIEGHGIEPDVAVEDDPGTRTEMGIDPQLQAAVREMMKVIGAKAGQ
ncbi:MAG TPA: S41 family peptidase [Thermoanaerobaculia bacterium]|nr:S41 family peptidase [Thermoanaerobaculia bacterium]